MMCFRIKRPSLTQFYNKCTSQNFIGRCQSTKNIVKPINKTVGFIGDGNMARAICKGIAEKGLIKYSQINVSSPYEKTLSNWKKLGCYTTIDNSEVMDKSDIIFLTIKPYILPVAMQNIHNYERAKNICNKLFISILAGVTLETLQNVLSKFKGSRVVRVMPNTPMLVGEGASCYCPGKGVTDEDIHLVETLLKATGICYPVPENLVNSICAVAGSGPAYVYLLIEALADGGVRMGLHRDMAIHFAAQTVLGAAKMVLETDKHTGQLKDQVASSGGTTMAAIHVLEKNAFRGILMSAVEAAVLRAEEMGKKT